MDEPDARSPSRASMDGDPEGNAAGGAGTFRTETYSTIGSSAASISDSARAIVIEDIQDVLEDSEAHNADVIAAEHRRVDGWSTVRFHAGAFFEQFVYQVFYPFAMPITLFVRGKHALYNMRMIPRPEKEASGSVVYALVVFTLYFINNLATFLAISAVTLWGMRFYSIQVIGEDLNSTADAAYWRSLDYEVAMLVFNIVFQRAILALKYAYLPGDDYEQLMTAFMPLEVLDADQLLSGWTDVATGTIKKEVSFSAARLGIIPAHVHVHLSREQYRQFISGLSAKALEMMMGLCQGGKTCKDTAAKAAAARLTVAKDRPHIEAALVIAQDMPASATAQDVQACLQRAQREATPTMDMGLQGARAAPPVQASAVSEAEVELAEAEEEGTPADEELQEQGERGATPAHGQGEAQPGEGEGEEVDSAPSRGSSSDGMSSAPSSVPAAQPALDTEWGDKPSRGRGVPLGLSSGSRSAGKGHAAVQGQVLWGDAMPVHKGGTRASVSSLPSSVTGGQRALSPTEQERKARPVVLPVDMLCTAIFAHANTMAAAYATKLSKLSISCGTLVAFLPMIVRASWRLPVIGRGAVGGFIAVCTAFSNMWLLTLLLLYLQTGVLDYERRQKCFSLLGELATRRYGSMPTAGFGGTSRLASTRMLATGTSDRAAAAPTNAVEGGSEAEVVKEWSRGEGAVVSRQEGEEQEKPVAINMGRPGALRHRPGAGGFVPPRLERRPSTLTATAPPALQPPILSLDTVGNIRAWLLSRRILSGIGTRYFRRLTIIASVALLFVSLLAVAIIAQLLLQNSSRPSSRSSTSTTTTTTTGSSSPASDAAADLAAMGQVGDFIMALDTMVLSAILAVYLGWMLLAGAKANESVAAHTAIILSKQVEATQAMASYETRRDSMLTVGGTPNGLHARRAASSALKWRHALSMLEVVRQSLGYEEPLTVLGFPASYGFAQSVASAAVTAQSVVVTLLNDKYGWLSWAGRPGS